MTAGSMFVVSAVLAFAVFETGCVRPGSQEAAQEGAPAPDSRDPSSATSRAGTAGVERTVDRVAGRGRWRNAAGPGRYGRGRGHYDPVSLTDSEQRLLKIETIPASYRSIRSIHSAMGKVVAPQTRMAKVSYAFPGRISRILSQVGDWVDQGQPVLILQCEEVGRAKTEYYKAVADLELARTSYEREKRLVGAGVGAQKNVLATEAGFKVAQASLEAAEKKLHVLGFNEEEVRAISATHQVNPEITLFAPIEGKVIELNAVLGGMIDQATELMTIMDPTRLWVTGEIFERDIEKIRIGQEAHVTLPAYPGEAFRGKLTYISDLLKEDTRTISVRTEVDNRNFKLKPGMFADMTIVLRDSRQVLTVPEAAVLDDNNEKIVFVRADGQFLARPVTLGPRHNGYFAIESGLADGEEVVVQGGYQLKSKLYDDLLKQPHVH